MNENLLVIKKKLLRASLCFIKWNKSEGLSYNYLHSHCKYVQVLDNNQTSKEYDCIYEQMKETYCVNDS